MKMKKEMIKMKEMMRAMMKKMMKKKVMVKKKEKETDYLSNKMVTMKEKVRMMTALKTEKMKEKKKETKKVTMTKMTMTKVMMTKVTMEKVMTTMMMKATTKMKVTKIGKKIILKMENANVIVKLMLHYSMTVWKLEKISVDGWVMDSMLV